jgi:uncharacterized membrane protein YfcA
MFMKFILYTLLAFICEYVDSTLGMGYGTTLMPLLLLIGFEPLQIVPAILFSEFVTGVLAGIFHHKLGNVFFDFRSDDRVRRSKLGFLGYIPRSFDAKITYMLIVMGVIGVLTAVFFSLNVSKFILTLYIGLMIFCIGIYILFRIKKPSIFRWKKFIIIAILSGFNKGVSGGGYGPLVTGGQVVSGRSAKSSVGSTSLAEGIVCFVGFFAYLFARGRINWTLALPLLLGAVLSTPFSAYTVKKIPEQLLKVIIGFVTIILGILTLIKLFS